MVYTKEEHLMDVMAKSRERMERDNLDALVASSCENFYYLSGHQSTFMYTLRMNEVALAVMFRNPNSKTIIIMNEFEAAGIPDDLPNCEVRTYPTWVDVDDPFELKGTRYEGKRPTAHQVQEMFEVLRQVLDENGISSGRVALELNTMRYPSVMALQKVTERLELLEAGPVFLELRAIKTPWEIEQLRKCCAYAEAGIKEAVRGIRVGNSADDIAFAFRQALMKNREGSTSRFHMISVGDHFAPAHVFDTRLSKPGDLIKFDVGVEVEGYGSDIARTFVLGYASSTVERVYNALRIGHDHLVQLIEPGRSMQSVFDEGMRIIRRSGLPNYNRGHLGHSAGLSLAAEEAPFISPAEQIVFQPGMVMCLETPYYGYGVGSIMIEDMVLVKENGCERLNQLSKDLISL